VALPDPLLIEPLAQPPEGVVHLPGSKSITNRALVCAALASGTSVLDGALEADDTLAMVEGLRQLGVEIASDWPAARLTVAGVAGQPVADAAIVDARLSGTTSRFLLPVAALGEGHRRVDGANGLRERPMGDIIDAVRALGGELREVGAPGHLPVDIAAGTLAGGEVRIRGAVSSQFLSGLLLSGPAMRTGLVVHVDGPLVSEPYVAMTVAVMAAFGAWVERPDEQTWVVAPKAYVAVPTYPIEPDASAASYVFAAAAILGGPLTVAGLGPDSLQGDLGFADLLGEMGAAVVHGPDSTTVTGTGTLRGIDVDLRDLSDMAQTLAVVAVFAEGPTRVRGIGFIRGKETDRIAAVVTELRRLGIAAEEEPDGFVVHPGPIRGATVATYDDHRMAMSFALAGLRTPGVRIADPGCVAKTFPGYWALLEAFRRPGPGTMVTGS